MASSNRHWPSMFKSKPCSQWQHDHLIASSCHRSPYTSAGCEERSPEPKPRWNPRPEQIRILEAIFNSGMVNPPRDEIRKIRGQLQEYGQVGDANVFYWFQNRKSRSKHKLRHKHHLKPPATSPSPSSTANAKTNTSFVVDDYQLLQGVGDTNTCTSTEGLMAGPLHSHHHQEEQQQSAGLFFGDIMKMKDVADVGGDDNKPLLPPVTILDDHVLSPIDLPQLLQEGNDNNNGSEEAGSMVGKSTVIINDVAFEVPVGPFNVREAFGDDAVLINSYGHPVLTDQWGLTLHSLTHGAFYYLI